MKIKRVAFGVLMMSAVCAMAATRYVVPPGVGGTPVPPYDTDWAGAATNLQDAVAATAAGDVVLVSNGVYQLTDQLVITNFTIRSYNNGALDRDGTIINGNNHTGKLVTNRCFTLSHTNALVEGFTITNGYVINAGGGGVSISAGTLRACLVTGNYMTNSFGGGVYATGAGSLITNCDIIANAAWGPGAGAYITTSARLTGSRINKNQGTRALSGDGAGVYVNTGATMYNCEIISNATAYAGPGNVGAGVTLKGTTIRNCLIVGNSGAYCGGGVGTYSGGRVENCTIAGNSAGSGAGVGTEYAIYTVWIVNTICRDAVRSSYDRSIFYITNSCLVSTNIIGASGTGNIITPPTFVNQPSGNYRLRPWSAGVDAGLWQSWMTNAADLDNQPRLSANNLPDMGAYETTGAPVPIQYVARGGQTPLSPYTNWVQAASNVSDAIDVGYDGNTILISNGVYTLTNQVAVGNRTITSCHNGVQDRVGTIVNGGYPNTTNRCFSLSSISAVVAGLTITNGFAGSVHGGGVYMTAGTLSNCVVTGNAAANGSGGGIYMSGGTVSNCVVAGNTATNGDGGGVYAAGASALLMNCDITSNVAYGSGAGAYLTTSARLTGSRIRNNQVLKGNKSAAGVYMGDAAVLYNCEIIGNRHISSDANQQFGGGVWIDFINATVRNCLIVGNVSGIGGGVGITSAAAQGGIVESCTIAGNSSTTAGSGVGMAGLTAGKAHIRNTICRDVVGCWYAGPSFYVTNSCLLSTNISGAVSTNWSSSITNDPRFVNASAGNYRLNGYSPCVNAGTNAAWMTAGVVDLDGNVRISPIIGGTVDMGAYEFPVQSGSIFSVR